MIFPSQLSLTLGLALLLGFGSARAEDPLIERTPFDRISLSASSGGGVIEVLPLTLPVRQMPATKPDGVLKVRLVENSSTPYEVNWADIERIDFYEQLLLAEGTRLLQAGELTAAFDYLNLLAREYRTLSGVDAFAKAFLQKSAAAAYRSGQLDRALAILAGLYERDPRSAGLERGVDAIGEKRMQELIANRDLNSAREFLDRTEAQFTGVELPFATRWRQKFESTAQAQVETGEQLLKRGDYQAARRAAAQARDILPNSPAADQLMERIGRLYPIAVVGVLELADPSSTARMDTPVARRVAAATSTPVMELRDYRAEGGEYVSPWGDVNFDLATRQLTLTLDLARLPPSGRLTAPYQVAQWALEGVDPAGSQFDPALAEVLESVRVEQPASVVFQLRRSHTRPPALLLGRQWEWGGEQGRFELTSPAPGQAILKPRAREGAEKLLTINEVLFADERALIAGLVRGEIDIVADVPPWRWTELAERSDIRLGQYRLPRLHVLLVNHHTPLLQQREFRRALCYGIDREEIVREVLLAGEKTPGFAVLSGPLPIGEDLSDSFGYAYNDQLLPRPYDPRLAAILVTTAWTALAKQAVQPAASRVAADELTSEPLVDAIKLAETAPPLRLAHAADPVARLASQTIVQQLGIIGVKVELVQLAERELNSSAAKWDLRYAELTMQEPLVDARKLLGPGGIAGACSDPMDYALRQVDAAQNPREVTAALAAVHKAATSDLPVIPLWQTVDRFAYRTELLSVPPSVIELYQTAAKWRRQTGESE